jgi:hypothetical protein
MTALTETTSGRLIPRTRPRAEPCDMWFKVAPDGSAIAVCRPCDTQYHLDRGHTVDDLASLAAQHSGPDG